MLILISDIHLTDGSTASNAHPSAFDLLGNEVLDSLGECKGTELHLVLLGDIFDLVRTDYWHRTYPGNLDARPWGGAQDAVTGMNTAANVVSDFGAILDLILATPSAVALIDMLHRLHAASVTAAVDFKLTYVVGNHDRAMNNYPSLKQAVVSTFDAKGIPFEIANFSAIVDEPNYQLLARHGHEWDPICYGFDFYNQVLSPNAPAASRFDAEVYPVITIGEVLTAELMAGLVFFTKQNLDPNNLDDNTFLCNLREVNNLRPLSKAFDWLGWFNKNLTQQRHQDILKQALIDALGNTTSNRLAQEWKVNATLIAVLKDIHWSLSTLGWGITKGLATTIETVISPFTSDKNPLTEGAEDEFQHAAKNGYRFVAYGHTHEALDDCFTSNMDGTYHLYVNTGTMLPVIEPSTADDSFSTVNRMTLSFFYLGTEDTSGRADGAPTVELWNGRKRKNYVCA